MTPSCKSVLGLEGMPHDIFLELGNGEKYLFREYVLDVPVVIARSTLKVGLTVTKRLHDVDLMLGINWFQLVNPMIG